MRVTEALDTKGISFDHENIVLKQEEVKTELDEEMPSFEMDSAYIEDKIKEEVRIENSDILELKDKDSSPKSSQNTDHSKVAEDENPTSSGINDIIAKSGSDVKITTHRINEIKKMIKSYEKKYPIKFSTRYQCSTKFCKICNIKFKDYTTERIFWHYKKSRHSEQVKKVFKKWTLKKDKSTKISSTKTDEELIEKCL